MKGLTRSAQIHFIVVTFTLQRFYNNNNNPWFIPECSETGTALWCFYRTTHLFLLRIIKESVEYTWTEPWHHLLYFCVASHCFLFLRFLSLVLSYSLYPGSQVVTYKNHALNNFLEALAKNSSPDEKIVRVGNLPEDADEKLKRLLLGEVCL